MQKNKTRAGLALAGTWLVALAPGASAQGETLLDWTVDAPFFGNEEITVDPQGRVALRQNDDLAYQAHAFRVALFESDGQEAWSYEYAPSNTWNELVTRIRFASDGSVLACGYQRSIQWGDGSVIAVKLSDQGQPDWFRIIPGQSFQSTPIDMAVDPQDNALILTGEGLIHKLDPSGNILWTTAVGPAWSQGQILARGDGSIVVQRQDYAASLNEILELDSSGNVNWSYVVSANLVPRNSFLLARGETLITGFEYGGGPFRALRLDTNGQPIWSVVDTPPNQELFSTTAVLQRPNGNLVVCGDRRVGLSGFPGWRFFELSLVDGSYLWEETYSESPFDNESQAAVLDSEGSLFVTGKVDSSGTNRLVKFGAQGNLEWTTSGFFLELRLGPQGALIGLDASTIRRVLPRVGQSFCDAVPNSTGATALLSCYGSEALMENGLVLHASNLPPQQTVLAIAAPVATSLPMFAGAGTLCLQPGTIGRGVPGQSSAAGTRTDTIDLFSIPSPMGPVSGVIGETWNFQYWFRDPPTTNFSKAAEIVLR